MSSQSNAVSGSFELQSAAPAAISPGQVFYWSVRRELWENRSIYIAPLAAAGVFLAGFLISTIHLPAQIRNLSLADAMLYRQAVAAPYDFVAGLMMATSILVSIFYCLDALYGERRDRSVLFWKSMPVSDTTTVLAKASVPLLVLPLLTFAVAVVTQFIMLLWSSAVLLGSGLSVGPLWQSLSFGRMSLHLLYHMVTAHGLWPAPVYCWLLLVSAWARRAPFIWAVLPPFVISGVEKIAFNTSYFATAFGERFIGHISDMQSNARSDYFPTNPAAHTGAVEFLSSPGLWVGLMLAALFLVGAVYLRRNRKPI